MRECIPPAGPANFEDLYAEHGARVLSLLSLLGVAKSDRDDVSQEVWADVHRALPTFDPNRGTARAWIFGIARGAARDWRRSRQRRPEFSTPTDREPIDPRTSEMEQMEAQQLEALLSYLERTVPKQNQREAFLLHEVCGLTVEEVAEVTEAKPVTAKWRIMMARRRLKEEMTEEERRRLLAILPVFSVDAFVRALRDAAPKGSDEELARVWERVTERIEAEGGSVDDPLGGPETVQATPPNPAAPSGYMVTGPQVAAALGGVFLLGVAVGAGVLHALSPERDRGSLTVIEQEIPAPFPAPSPVPEPAPSASAPPSASSSNAVPWQSEQWLLDRAQMAEPAEALRLTERHALFFPRSNRAAAREEIAIRALVQLGRRGEAEERAARLVRWAPLKAPAMADLFGRSLL